MTLSIYHYRGPRRPTREFSAPPQTRESLTLFGERLREWRGTASQSDLGILIGVSGSAVSSWECGFSHPVRHRIEGLAEALGVEAAELADLIKASKASKGDKK